MSTIASTAVAPAPRPIRKPSQTWYIWPCSSLRTCCLSVLVGTWYRFFWHLDNSTAGHHPCISPQHYSKTYATLTRMRSLPASSSQDGIRRSVRACITFLLAAVFSASLGQSVARVRHMSMVTVMRHIRTVGGATRQFNLSRTVSRHLLLMNEYGLILHSALARHGS